MKKSLIAAAVLAIGGGVHAQSNVTLSGTVDAGVTHTSTPLAKKTQVVSSGISSSMVRFSGVEDLGGGLKAAFWLEAGFNADDGTGFNTNSNNQTTGTSTAPSGTQGLTFNRRSTVSVGGTWGELRVGRDYTPAFYILSTYDPFSGLGVGTNQAYLGTASLLGPTAVRASNSIAYHWGHGFNGTHSGSGANGLNASVMAFVGENLSNTPNSDDGNGYSLKIGWNKRPLDVAVSYGRTKFLTGGDAIQGNAVVAYDFGIVRPMVQLLRDKRGPIEGKGYLVGAKAPVGSGEIRASYSGYKTDAAGSPETRKIALGYVHFLSKRTSLYASYAHLKNDGGASNSFSGGAPTTANGSGNGYTLGMRHVF